MDPQELIDDLNDVLLSDYYRFIEILGQGSFGIVVAAYSSQMDKVVAVKVLTLDIRLLNILNKTMNQIYCRSVRIRIQLNCIKYEISQGGSNRQQLYISDHGKTTGNYIGCHPQNYCPRGIGNKKYNVIGSECLSISPQKRDYSQRPQARYCGVNLENIFICENNYVKLIDLGLGYQIICRGFVGQQVGTPYYIAPEVINGLEQTQAVDIFSLGIIFYQMISQNKHPLWVEGQCKKDYYKLISDEFTIQFPSNLSKMAKDFVENTVTFNSIDRMTAEQCLEHPWVLGEERKSHPITNKEIKQRYAFTGKLSIILKALYMLKILKEQCQEEIHYMKTQCSDEVFEDLPMTSRVHTETMISNHRSLRKPESSKSIKLTKTTSHQDLTIMKNRLLNSKKLLSICLTISVPRYKHSVDVLLPPKMNSLKKISQLPQISPNVTRQSSFNFRLA